VQNDVVVWVEALCQRYDLQRAHLAERQRRYQRGRGERASRAGRAGSRLPEKRIVCCYVLLQPIAAPQLGRFLSS